MLSTPSSLFATALVSSKPAPSPDGRHLAGPEMSRAEVAEVCEEKDPAVICSFLLFFPSEGRGEKTQTFTKQAKRGEPPCPLLRAPSLTRTAMAMFFKKTDHEG